jgi:hypothetical protein
MAITHIPDGGDFFGPEHASTHKSFGFHGSVEHRAKGGRAAPPVIDEPTHEKPHFDRYAKGGEIHHGHPHGHEVEHVEHHKASGAVIHHHTHGGYTVHHRDGEVEHFAVGGAPCEMEHARHGGMEHMHDPESEYVHRAHGGHMKGHESPRKHHAKGGHAGHPDEAQDRALIKRMMAEHEKGEGEDQHFARGGMPIPNQRFPRSMKPAVSHRSSPINTPPRNPGVSSSVPNEMPGGQMPYGVQPSDEGDGGMPAMSRGGAMRKRG